MRKSRVAIIIISVVENNIPDDVSQWIQAECSIVVNDLNEWSFSPVRRSMNEEDLLGVFGFENDKPIIGINYRVLKTIKEVVQTVKHEIAHSWLWHLGLPNGERITNKLVREWENDC